MGVAVLSVFALAGAAPWLHRFGRGRTGWLLALLPAMLAVYFATFGNRIADGESISLSYRWIPSLGVSLSFYLDGLSLLFTLLITGIGALILIYAGGYMAGRSDLGSFYAFLLLFMGSMLGLVLADNVITLFVFWEMTSISSYLLIGFDHNRAESRAAALQALLVTNAGGLAMLAGLILLSQVGGSPEISLLKTQADAIQADDLYLPILLLILAGAFTKSAQFPFHFWLPGAMAAPTPVSAYLHSATMVKAGVYLLARFSPILGGTDAWTGIVTVTGTVTMLVGGGVALYQTDLKRILAYSTVSALGTLVLLLGQGTTVAATGAMAFLLAHALYKGALFMIAGSVDHETGTRDVDRLGGLRRAMPVTAAAAALAAISMAGFGPVFSFIGKELLNEAVLETETARTVLVLAALLGSAMFVAAAGLTGVRPFVGVTRATPKPAHEAPMSMWLGPALLATLSVILGVAPGAVERVIVIPAAGAVLGTPPDLHLALWHGFNPALTMSVVSVTAGIGLYFGWTALRRATPWMNVALTWGPARIYGWSLRAIGVVARTQTLLLQNGRLRVYLMVTIVAAIGLSAFTLVSKDSLHGIGSWSNLRFYQVGLAVVMLLAALYATVTTSRLAAVAALSVVGYGVALIYVWFGAPDLAMTQFMVETLTVILFVLVFYHLPRLRSLSGSLSRARDIAIALAAGGFMTALVLAASAGRGQSRLASYYAEESVPGGHGQNVVNVILVDFRALDTLGEITVLSVAAFGVFALLRLRPTGKERRTARIVGSPATDRRNQPPPERPAVEMPAPHDMRGDDV